MPATLQLDPSQSISEPTLARSQGSFPESEFVTIENVPTFCEHETTDSKGRKLKFGPIELQAIADRCNQRITSTGDYAVCCFGHTPSPDAKATGAAMPEVAGFVGPFRLGRMQQPEGGWLYCILADYHIYKSELERFKRHPRRSPELWLEERYEDMFLDPIALLGAEPPRLDMGLLYSRWRSPAGKERIKYSAAPGAMNTFIPDDRLRHSAEADEDESMSVDAEEITRTVIDALSELPVWRWIESKMQEESLAGESTGGMADGTAPTETAEAPVEPAAEPVAPVAEEVPAEPPVEAPPVEAPAEPAPEVPAEPAPEADPPAEDPADEVVDPAERERLQRYEAIDQVVGDMDDDEFEQYAAARRSKRSHRRKGYSCDEAEVDVEVDVETDDEPEQYSRKGEVAKYAKRVQELEARVVNGERRETLLDLQMNQGVILDVDEEMERLCYQRMPSAEDFELNCKIMRKHYQRSPMAGLPVGIGDEDVANVVKFQRDNPKEVADAAKQLCMQYQREGKTITYADARRQILEKRTGRAS